MRLRPLPALTDNYIWLIDDGAHAVAVDPGVAEPVLRQLEADRLSLAAVLLTHHHADHIGGVAGLLRAGPDVQVYGPCDPRVPSANRRVGEGDIVVLDAPALAFRVFEIPGHTLSHIAYEGAGMLFCGDTLFSLGCGRMFEGTPGQFHSSLARIAALPDDTRVCCGHEYTVANGHFARLLDPENIVLAQRCDAAIRMRASNLATVPSRLSEERAANPFLRVGSDAVLQALTQRHGEAPRDEVEGFAWLRAWKDEFRAPPS